MGNLTIHQVLLISQRVAQSHVPLKIMMTPLRTQAGTVKAYMKFVEFLARRVVALQERLGQNTSSVPLELESGSQSMTKREHFRSPSPARKSPSPSRHSSPTRTDSAKKAPVPSRVNKDLDVFSPQSQNSMSLWASLNLSNEEMDDIFTNEEGQNNHQTPLLPPGKCQHNSTDENKSPSKKAKLDMSNLYRPDSDVPSEGGRGKTDGITSDPEKSKAHKPKKAKKSKKKNKKDKKEEKDKKGEGKKDEKDEKKSTSAKKTPEKKKVPEMKMPEKKKMPEKTQARRGSSSGMDLNTPETPKSKKKLVKIHTEKECHTDKWASNSPLVIGYRQCVNISVHNLAEGRNHTDHTDFIRQLMRHATLGINIKYLDDRIKELIQPP